MTHGPGPLQTGSMPQPRKRLVSLSDTPYYHCISRCVRRAFLCGVDSDSGYDFSHRRGWIVERMNKLATVFAVRICAYAVMSNHYHIVVRIDREQALSWSDLEVAERWLQVFSGPELVRQLVSGASLCEAELEQVSEWIFVRRQRLYDLSWFMRCLNEPIARMANREDDCTGRFWEGRFRSQALLDERALLACMAYVDLNPVRAALARTPEESEFTSIKERIEQPDTSRLSPFNNEDNYLHGIPFAFEDYLQLVDWAGRAVQVGKRGHIPLHTPPILERLGMEQGALLDYLGRKPGRLQTALGPIVRMRVFARSVGLKFVKGMDLSKKLCPGPC